MQTYGRPLLSSADKPIAEQSYGISRHTLPSQGVDCDNGLRGWLFRFSSLVYVQVYASSTCKYRPNACPSDPATSPVTPSKTGEADRPQLIAGISSFSLLLLEDLGPGLRSLPG